MSLGLVSMAFVAWAGVPSAPASGEAPGPVAGSVAVLPEHDAERGPTLGRPSERALRQALEASAPGVTVVDGEVVTGVLAGLAEEGVQCDEAACFARVGSFCGADEVLVPVVDQGRLQLLRVRVSGEILVEERAASADPELLARSATALVTGSGEIIDVGPLPTMAPDEDPAEQPGDGGDPRGADTAASTEQVDDPAPAPTGTPEVAEGSGVPVALYSGLAVGAFGLLGGSALVGLGLAGYGAFLFGRTAQLPSSARTVAGVVGDVFIATGAVVLVIGVGAGVLVALGSFLEE